MRKVIEKIDNAFSQYSYWIFLATLIFWIGFLPLFEVTGYIHEIEFAVMHIIIIASFYFFYHAGKKFQYLIVVPFTLLIIYLVEFTGMELLIQLERLVSLFLFYLITVHFIKKIIKSKEVDLELIIISISAYIMIAIMASTLCWFTYNLYPGAYNVEINENGPIMDFIYYTIVTMTTLGYGDITPQIPQSKSLAMIITLVGQFYMTILVAFLVGKFLNQRSK